ncbi:sugar porter family MFS transporter [Granulicella sp. dw_53]|uniref:sugar porter family MFS transporter n=1 Tax=Granulicella sp. dw_53 TaxID=2719792 RepID=UPI001BD5C6CE|nr:sugar porter family MFS transporter [Granulicella sp. dw_53]
MNGIATQVAGLIDKKHEGSNNFLLKLALVTSLSGLLFGFDTAVINGALISLVQQFNLSAWDTEIAAGSLLFGAMVGAAIGGRLSDRYGRRRMLSASALIFAASSGATALAQTLEQFSVARFLGGIAIGAGSVLAPLYLAEIAPADRRGRIVTMNQLAIVIGILIAYCVSWALASTGPNCWRWMFGIGIIPSIALWGGLFFVPESPRWLIQRGRTVDAERILATITSPESAHRQIHEVNEALQAEFGLRQTLWTKPLRRPMLIAIALAVFSQITGINTVLYYGSIMFQDRFSGQSATASIAINVVVGAVNLIGTIVSLFIIDRLGRRFLLISASAGMAVSLVSMAACFFLQRTSAALVVLSVLSYVTFFSVGMAPGMWAYISEVFPNAVRGRAVSLATGSLWSATLLVTVTFLSLTKRFGVSGAFLIYAALSVLSLLFVWKMVPETRGKSLEEIQQLWEYSPTLMAAEE